LASQKLLNNIWVSIVNAYLSRKEEALQEAVTYLNGYRLIFNYFGIHADSLLITLRMFLVGFSMIPILSTTNR